MSLPPPGSPPPGSDEPSGAGGGFAPPGAPQPTHPLPPTQPLPPTPPTLPLPTQPPGHQPGAGPPIGPPPTPAQTTIPSSPDGGGKPPWYKRPVTWAWALVAIVVIGGIGAFALTRGGDDDSSADRDDSDQATVPDDTAVADDTTAPEATTLAPGTTLPGGITLPPLSLPPGMTLPPGVTLPGDVTIPEVPTVAPPDETDDTDETTSPGTTVAPVGDLVELGDSADVGDGFTVTVNSFTEDATASLTSESANPAPSGGNVYSLVNVTIAFDGNPTFGYVALLDVSGVREPDVEVNWYDTLFLTVPDGLPLAEQIEPGDSVTGNIVLEVPEDATSELILRVASLLSFDSEGVDFALH